ncbi:MAG: hypothetical protein QW366_01225 [Sulfolobales archaeon]
MLYADLLLQTLDRFILELYKESGVRIIGLPEDLDEKDYLRDFMVIRRSIIDDIDRVRPRRNNLIAFKPSDKESARRAGKISSFPFTIILDEDSIEYCTREQIEIMRGGRASLEILARVILQDSEISRYLRILKPCVRYAIKNGIDVILSSGSRVSEEVFPPRSFRILERYLVGLRGVLTYSWYHLLEKWNKDLVRSIEQTWSR